MPDLLHHIYLWLKDRGEKGLVNDKYSDRSYIVKAHARAFSKVECKNTCHCCLIFWIKYAPNCSKMHLKFQKFKSGECTAIVYHSDSPPPVSKILAPPLDVCLTSLLSSKMTKLPKSQNYIGYSHTNGISRPIFEFCPFTKGFFIICVCIWH